jgi:hypothetical protein
MARRSPSQRRGQEIRGPFRPDPGIYMNHLHVPILPHARTGALARRSSAAVSSAGRGPEKAKPAQLPLSRLLRFARLWA